jgi:hypothetical protein
MHSSDDPPLEFSDIDSLASEQLEMDIETFLDEEARVASGQLSSSSDENARSGSSSSVCTASSSAVEEHGLQRAYYAQ